jgi:calpain-15
MSQTEPIQLIDDDDDDDQNDVICYEDLEKEKSICTFMEFSGSRDRREALMWLQTCNYNVQNAITKALEAQAVPSIISKQKIMVLCQKDSVENTLLKTDEDVPKPQLSQSWHVSTAKLSNFGRFVDPDFPPNQTSLDGRCKSSPSDTKLTKCACGVPAAAKSVQSDGPNFGRFYLCCGKLRQRQANYSKQQRCKFFQWDDKQGSRGAIYTTRYSLMTWEFCGLNTGHVLVQNSFSPNDVRQGAIGNCWFLSALAVIAEKSYLIDHLLPHRNLNAAGCYQINLCLDGQWRPILVDSHFPVVYGARIVDPLRNTGRILSKKEKSTETTASFQTAFCAVPQGQLWAALIEKAYAKAHGSYEHLSGGFIHEAFQDLTGAPTETLVFDGNIWDQEDLWARLLSCHEAGFLMGLATSKGGDGLVAGHAYSVLDVIEFNDMVIGEQQSIKMFLDNSPVFKKQKTTIRLVQIRNPWGKKEWQGEWSVNSCQWTSALRRRLGKKAFVKGDGTFFMSYHDMLQRFHHMDIVKCRKGWTHTSVDGYFLPGHQNLLQSSRSLYRLLVQESSYAFISIIQPKKRSNTKSTYWYTDSSIIILKRKSGSDVWETEDIVISGMIRISTIELFLEPTNEYVLIPFSLSTKKESQFRITSYSAKPINILTLETFPIGTEGPVCHLHKHLLKDERKLLFIVAENSALVCVHGNRCLYFLAINASKTYILSLRICLKLSKGQLILYGESGDISDVPPQSQKIVLVVSSNGSHSSATGIAFNYASDVVKIQSKGSSTRRVEHYLCDSIPITLAGELLSCAQGSKQPKGDCNIDTYHWVSQIGSYST